MTQRSVDRIARVFHFLMAGAWAGWAVYWIFFRER